MWLNSIFEEKSDQAEEVECLRGLVNDVDRIRYQLNEDVAFDSNETQVSNFPQPVFTPEDTTHMLSRKFRPVYSPFRLLRWVRR